jgi:transcriptional regulator with XRE-family HTH domain
MSLRERVRQRREERAWSQGELAERIGAGPAQISRYENGKITPSADAVIRLAELCGTDRELVLSFIDTRVTKTRLKVLVGGIS